MNWTDDYVSVMESLRLNSVDMSRNHKQKYFAYKRMSTWFRVPTIVLSALASVSSVGLQAYVTQQHIRGITCLVTMVIGYSIQLNYTLNWQRRLNLNWKNQKNGTNSRQIYLKFLDCLLVTETMTQKNYWTYFTMSIWSCSKKVRWIEYIMVTDCLMFQGKLCFLISGQMCHHLLRRRRHLSIQMTAMCHRWWGEIKY